MRLLGIALFAAHSADAYVLLQPTVPPRGLPVMQQSVIDKALEENRPEFSDDQISAVLRRTDVRTDGDTVEQRCVAAMTVLRMERAKEEPSLSDRQRQKDLCAAWLKSDGTTSWYDAGVRPILEDGPARPPVEVDLEPIEPPGKKKLSTSAQAGLAASLLSALAVIGIDIGSVGVVENLDTALLVGGLALSQVDSAGPVGTTLRAIGNATSGVFDFSSSVAPSQLRLPPRSFMSITRWGTRVARCSRWASSRRSARLTRSDARRSACPLSMKRRRQWWPNSPHRGTSSPSGSCRHAGVWTLDGQVCDA